MSQKSYAFYSMCWIFLLFWSSQLVCLEAGDLAPDFSLEASDGKTYQLSEVLKEHIVVIAWYPRAFTSGCTIECKSFAENGYLIKKMQVAYFMASVDPLSKNIDFALQNAADFPILSDPSKETAKEYEVLMMGLFAKRHTFYIDKNRTILFIDRNVRPSQSAQDIAAKLKELGVGMRS
tara:strand:+ start:34877 stop:35410 length:534 start_codon:yes stop_codon:yes gene_type:complete